MTFEELEKREDIYYFKGSDTPYTGKVFDFYENGQKRFESNWKNGEMNGLSMIWYENGQMKNESNWKDGKADGVYVDWHENGQKMYEGTNKNGEKVSAKYWNNKGELVDSYEEANK